METKTPSLFNGSFSSFCRIICLLLTLLPAFQSWCQLDCHTTTFKMTLPPTNGKIELKRIQTLPSGDFVLAGNHITTNGTRNGFLMRMDHAGVFISQQSLSIPANAQ